MHAIDGYNRCPSHLFRLFSIWPVAGYQGLLVYNTLAHVMAGLLMS